MPALRAKWECGEADYQDECPYPVKALHEMVGQRYAIRWVALSALLPMNVTIAPGLYRAMAAGVLSLHAVYIAWVIFGAFFTRGRPRLAALHIATLVYGMIIEIFGLWCPLTALETWLEVRGNVPAYRGPFLLRYLDAMVYPDIPPNLLIAGAVAVCIMNLWIYLGVSVSDIRLAERRPRRGLWECGLVVRRGS